MKKLVVVSALFAALVVAATPASAAKKTSEADQALSVEQVAELVTGLLPGLTADSCSHPLIENPFAFLGDTLDYVLAPNGSFEGTDGDGWLLEGGSTVVPGNDPFPVRAGSDDGFVLSMPGVDASAVSAPMCVDLDYPHFRLITHAIPRADGKYKGRLRVETLYPNAKNPKWRKVDTIKADSGSWTVSDFLDLAPERGGSEPGGRQVSLRFVVVGDGGGFEIDDVYVDPRRRT